MRRYGSFIAVGIVALVGVVNLPLPFFGDQALFTVMASMIADGSVLYVDVWDVKQPAIFLFYLAGGVTLGYSEVGLHAFEILYWALLAGVFAVTLRSVYRSHVAVVGVILLTAATYFVVVRPVEMGMVEGLVGLPLYLAFWFAYRPNRSRIPQRYRLFLSGLFGGLALLYKLFFFPIVLGFWLIALVSYRREDASNRGSVATAGWIVAGVAVPFTATIGYFALNGALGDLLWTTFVYPWEAITVQGGTKDLVQLARSGWWFGWSFLPACLLALVGMWRVFRSGRTQFDNLALVWLVAGSVVILVQRSSWWTWHFLLLLVPLGLFAGQAIDWISEVWGSTRTTLRIAFSLAFVAALLPGMVALVAKAGPLVSNDFAMTETGRERYEDEIWPLYGEIRVDGAFLDEPGAEAGPIYLYGDPTYNFLFNRDQALPVNGWSPQYWDADLWDRVYDDLVEYRPPYVQVAPWAAELMVERHVQTLEFLATEYDIFSESDSGTWYQR